MRFRRSKSSNKAKKGNSAPLQNGEKKVDGGGVGSNSRQVVPETRFASIDYGSSIDESFFEARPWLDSDCEDDFYSVNGDLTPARSIASQNSKTIPSGPPKLLTLGEILKAEPLNEPTPQRKLADLLRETQDGDSAVGDPGDLSRADSFRHGRDEGRCCVPQFARAMSCNGKGRKNK
ncbi:hypothetical protein ACP70R_032768 [Stipagrostis hirtigluma subsp. patula]